MSYLCINLNSPFEFWQIQTKHLTKIRERFPFLEVSSVKNEHLIKEILTKADFFYGWTFRKEWFKIAPNLKWIMTPAAGTDHLPQKECNKYGVMLLRSMGFHGIPMAQHAMAFILGFSRGLFISKTLQKTENWWKNEIDEVFFDLFGEAITIVGCGNIGLQTAALAKKFGLNVIGIRRNPPEDKQEILWMLPNQTSEAFNLSKIILNLLPSNHQTYHFFDDSRFAQMQKGSVFINMGRGSTVKEISLITAIKNGKVAWCGLDVFEKKPPDMNNPLRYLENVVMTPKSSVFFRKYMDFAVEYFINTLECYFNGEELDNIVINNQSALR